jgi:hypothetical protein
LIPALKSFNITIDCSDVAQQVSNATIMDVAVARETHPTPRFRPGFGTWSGPLTSGSVQSFVTPTTVQ